MSIASAFICDAPSRLFGRIPMPWKCGAIMMPKSGQKDLLVCKDCGHEKKVDTNPYRFKGVVIPFRAKAVETNLRPMEAC